MITGTITLDTTNLKPENFKHIDVEDLINGEMYFVKTDEDNKVTLSTWNKCREYFIVKNSNGDVVSFMKPVHPVNVIPFKPTIEYRGDDEKKPFIEVGIDKFIKYMDYLSYPDNQKFGGANYLEDKRIELQFYAYDKSVDSDKMEDKARAIIEITKGVEYYLPSTKRYFLKREVYEKYYG